MENFCGLIGVLINNVLVFEWDDVLMVILEFFENYMGVYFKLLLLLCKYFVDCLLEWVGGFIVNVIDFRVLSFLLCYFIYILLKIGFWNLI